MTCSTSGIVSGCTDVHDGKFKTQEWVKCAHCGESKLVPKMVKINTHNINTGVTNEH